MKLRRIDFYPDDFLVGVAGLRPEQIGVYWVICSLIYSTGGPIKYDDKRLSNITGMRADHLKRVLNSLESDAKVTRNGDEMMVKRCRNEIEKATERISKSRENGAKGGRPKDLAEPGGSGVANPPAPSPSPPPPPIKNPPTPQGELFSNDFLTFWEAYPHKVGKKAAWRAWRTAKDKPDLSAVLDTLKAYVDSKPSDRSWCNPSTWINQGRWSDETNPQPANGSNGRNWDFAARFYKQHGQWPAITYGPGPKSRGCECPIDVLQKHGLI